MDVEETKGNGCTLISKAKQVRTRVTLHKALLQATPAEDTLMVPAYCKTFWPTFFSDIFKLLPTGQHNTMKTTVW